MSQNETIDLGAMAKTLWSRRILFLKVWAAVFVVASLVIISVPRTYSSQVKLAPELDNSAMGGALGSVAAEFGFDVGSMSTTDAISPELYPELLMTNDFVVPLFDIPVVTFDGELRTTYYDYLDRHQRTAWWNYPIGWLKRLLPKPSEPVGAAMQGGAPRDSIRHLTRREDQIAQAIRGSIHCSIDRKTSLITVVVTDQDREICATVADSLRVHLQQFIIKYRTQKANIDVAYYTRLLEESNADYRAALKNYAQALDANKFVSLESVRLQLQDMKSDVDQKQALMQLTSNQLQQARARLQQRTPAFTTLESPAVPLKAKGPKRMLFVLAMLVLATMATAAKVLYK